MGGKRLLLLAFAAALICGCTATYGAKQTHPQLYSLALRLHPGEQLVEHIDEVDRIEWKLPEKRLEQFRKGGVIIKEQQRLSSEVRSTVVWVSGGTARLLSRVNLTSVDVPRHTHRSFERTYALSLKSDNVALTNDALSIEDSAMAQLPAAAIRLGQAWQTREGVTTSLGSGFAIIDHVPASIDNGLLAINVHGWGEITGAEYHLPKLLPGSIELTGTAWYDLQSGLITQESYLIHNRLLRPMEGELNGFDEILTVDVITRKSAGT